MLLDFNSIYPLERALNMAPGERDFVIYCVSSFFRVDVVSCLLQRGYLYCSGDWPEMWNKRRRLHSLAHA